jgi:hypothetical protein
VQNPVEYFTRAKQRKMHRQEEEAMLPQRQRLKKSRTLMVQKPRISCKALDEMRP